MTEQERITEQTKAESQMERVRQMNRARKRAAEIVNSEWIDISCKWSDGKYAFAIVLFAVVF